MHLPLGGFHGTSMEFPWNFHGSWCNLKMPFKLVELPWNFHTPVSGSCTFHSGMLTFHSNSHVRTGRFLDYWITDYWKIPLCFAFVDYEKAFDSIKFTPLFTALANQGVDPAYYTILRDLYNGATSTLKLHKDSNKISLERGVRQGDNISPKLFTACLRMPSSIRSTGRKKEST